ncbi:hypothetical protein N7495_006797 [Penicillium taxi]|uniref:uncharacterized protein n=1 Tax=Penicillium taxi TaxID=168475 RepID=UPI002544F8CC|nr:uncharacterized protein N7495_006797 [Penicillium taxi]KAJ5895106.1 hypothetical protein N7495_006797 [Penicillium taxi]
MRVTTHPQNPPALGELAVVIQQALEANFASATVKVVECPDLRQAPFSLAAPGLSGNPCIADIGGQSNLFPSPNFEAKYSLLSLAKDMQMSPAGGSLIGAGAGPFQDIGRNSELAPNISWTAKAPTSDFDDVNSLQVTNQTYVIQTRDDGSPCCDNTPSTNCALMMNLYGSNGDTGLVLKVTARARRGDLNFTNAIRLGLHDHYGDKSPVSLGGVFLLKSGKAKFHIMPDFPPKDQLPFQGRDQLENQWLTYHIFQAPVVCLTVMHSADPEGLGLRMEHTHCFETGGNHKGGHYHYDIEEEEVEYEAYLHPASILYRIDQPN